MLQEIYIIDDSAELIKQCKTLLKDEKEFRYKFKNIKTEDLDLALKNIPSLFIIHEDAISIDILEVCARIKADENNIITPMIVISSNSDKKHRVSVLKATVEYYIKKPIENQYLLYTIKNLIRLMYMNRRVSPLTGLPGNVQIDAEMKKRLLNREQFAILYFDLDNFKSYNDVYGFLRGDEIIKLTARTIVKHIHGIEENDSFVGHIGGDDFVAVVSETDYDTICQDIIAEFDSQVKKYYSDEDIAKGYLEVANRKGVIEQFPLTSISIGVVEADAKRFHNILEIGEVGAQVKHLAKTVLGSTYIIDKRRK